LNSKNYPLLSYAAAIYLASKAKAIITLRSGFSELLSTLNVPQFILYTKHRFSNISVEKTCEVHSLQKYPFVNQSLINEFCINGDLDESYVAIERFINENL